MEPPADVIAHAAGRHRLERGQGHPGRLRPARAGRLPQQEQQLAGTRKLRSAAEAAAALVEGRTQLRDGARQGIGARHVARRVAPAGLSQLVDHGVGRTGDARPIAMPDAADLLQDLDETGPSPAGRRWKVGAPEERLELRRQPHAHRPAAGAGRGLDERHVDAIDVGPLLAVDLDRNEFAVQDGGHLIVLERLVGHDVAPVAGGIADRQEDRLVLAPRRLEGLGAPRAPVDGVVGVLKEVRTLFGTQPVGHALHYRWWTRRGRAGALTAWAWAPRVRARWPSGRQPAGRAPR